MKELTYFNGEFVEPGAVTMKLRHGLEKLMEEGLA